eukprot:sb/3477761/
MGAPVSTAYSASKHALMGYFSSLRRELFSYGIDVITVCPGPVRSNISLHSFTEKEGEEYNQDIKDKGKKMEADRFYNDRATIRPRPPGIKTRNRPSQVNNQSELAI